MLANCSNCFAGTLNLPQVADVNFPRLMDKATVCSLYDYFSLVISSSERIGRAKTLTVVCPKKLCLRGALWNEACKQTK
jgi:hypothetical protein